MLGLKFLSGIMRRIETRMWNDEGLGLPLPEDWAYYNHLLPYAMADALVERIVSSVTREHVTRDWICGTPEDVARQIALYLQPGVDWVMPIDYLPVVGSPADAEAVAARGAERCKHLKRLTAAPLPAA